MFWWILNDQDFYDSSVTRKGKLPEPWSTLIEEYCSSFQLKFHSSWVSLPLGIEKKTFAKSRNVNQVPEVLFNCCGTDHISCGGPTNWWGMPYSVVTCYNPSDFYQYHRDELIW